MSNDKFCTYVRCDQKKTREKGRQVFIRARLAIVAFLRKKTLLGDAGLNGGSETATKLEPFFDEEG